MSNKVEIKPPAMSVGKLSGDDEVGRNAQAELAVLSPRQREILVLNAKGYEGGEIAKRFDCSPSSVHTHIAHTRRKLGMTTNEAIVLAAKAGWV